MDARRILACLEDCGNVATDAGYDRLANEISAIRDALRREVYPEDYRADRISREWDSYTEFRRG